MHHRSFLASSIPAVHALQWSMGLDVCLWNGFSTMSEQHICLSPEVPASREEHATSDRTKHTSSSTSSVWDISHCRDEYCVYTNEGFGGQGISLITTELSYHRVREFQASEPASRPSYEKIRVESIPGKGKGLVTTKMIHRGERLTAAKPALLVHRNAFMELEPEDVYNLIDVAVDSLEPSRRASYVAQAGTMGGHKNTDILFTNSFQLSIGDHDDGFHYGNFPEISLLNHDCRPNLVFYIDKNLTHHTQAVRDIKPGEELTISYIDILQIRLLRQERTHNSLGFLCGCSQCSLSREESDASDARILAISRMESELSDLSGQGPSSPMMIEKYLALHKEERLDSKMAGAYALAALNYNMLGKAEMTKKYARLSVQIGVMLDSGAGDLDANAMSVLAEDPKSHWSWDMKRRQAA